MSRQRTETSGPTAVAEPAVADLTDHRYQVTKVVHRTDGGGRYLAMDRLTGAEVVITHAWPPPAGNRAADRRGLLTHQAWLQRHLASSGVVTRLLAETSRNGHVLVIEESPPARSLRQRLNDDSAGLTGHALAKLATRLASVLRSAHAAGVVLRGLSVDTVLVLPDGDLRLIDLGTAAIRDGDGWACLPHPGVEHPPDPLADLHRLGRVLLHVFCRTHTDLPPDLPAGTRARSLGSRLTAHLDPPLVPRPAPEPVRSVISGLLRDDPAGRPSLDRTIRLLEAAPPAPDQDLWWPADDDLPPSGDALPDGDSRWRQLVDGIVGHLAACAAANRGVRPWPEVATRADADPVTVQHGVAGTVAALTALVRSGDQNRAEALLDTLLDRLTSQLMDGRSGLPGLYEGLAGTAWAVSDAARVLDRPDLLDLAVDIVLDLPTGGAAPDQVYGTAGLGTGLLHLWRHGPDQHGTRERLLARATACAEHLLATRDSGRPALWTFDPPGTGLTGYRAYGYAHGTAGIGAFLLAAGAATGRSDLTAAAEDCGRTLLDAAIQDGPAAFWPSTPQDSRPMPHWCHGSSGAGTFLCRLYTHTGRTSYLDGAVAAAVATVSMARWRSSTASCHGLAGNGEFLLDLFQLTGDPTYARYAGTLAELLWARRVYLDGLAVPPDETGRAVTGGYAVGLSGHLAFLVRLRHGGPRLFHPPATGPAPAASRPAR